MTSQVKLLKTYGASVGLDRVCGINTDVASEISAMRPGLTISERPFQKLKKYKYLVLTKSTKLVMPSEYAAVAPARSRSLKKSNIGASEVIGKLLEP